MYVGASVVSDPMEHLWKARATKNATVLAQTGFDVIHIIIGPPIVTFRNISEKAILRRSPLNGSSTVCELFLT
jgi:hypothetical protein